ncbi:hypothetical protein [Acetobacterium bakii]|uniref:hypothetical protein n=1 Tax=Acetobacterium bakii TaxID=52689 RepID=UPI00068378E1|nr:hypothetical protein [Acetobacterium bakii]
MKKALINEKEVNASQSETNGLVGWSTRYEDPEIIAAAKEKYKSGISYLWALVVIFPFGFLLAGLFFETMLLAAGLIIGAVLGLLMVGLNWFYIKNKRKQIWEGVITEKYQQEKPDDDSDQDDMDYVLVVEKTNGKKHHMIYHNRREMYDYFQIGDRLRYHVGLSTYEKYDKSKDHIIYCNVCSTENPISNDRCDHCNNLLFK